MKMDLDEQYSTESVKTSVKANIELKTNNATRKYSTKDFISIVIRISFVDSKSF